MAARSLGMSANSSQPESTEYPAERAAGQHQRPARNWVLEDGCEALRNVRTPQASRRRQEARELPLISGDAVGDAVGGAVSEAKRDAVGDAVGDAEGDAVGGAVRSRRRGRRSNPSGERRGRGEAKEDAVSDVVGDAVGDAVGSAERCRRRGRRSGSQCGK